MAYTINLTDGTVFATITDGTINTSSSMTLVGKNYAGYGEFLDENFIHLLESGSNTTAPAAPLTGQLWWDKTNNLLKVYNGAIFKTISAAVSVSKISNGTSEANIGASGGNANISIGGTSNVAVFTTSTAFFISDISVSGIQKVGSNAVGNIGSSSNYFNQVFATATTALYADVAERFAADEVLEPGTVVELGGINEITRSTQDLSENVFGVISTRPAYTMNGGAGENDTHPPVAMTGRVPVKCVGTVRKGDRLVSAGDGVARAAQPGEATAFNVIGRSLENKTTTGIGTIEAIVTIK